jgi:hypothetical protein
VNDGIGLLRLLMLASSVQPADPDELCNQLTAFELRASPAGVGQPQWIDVYWHYDPDAIFSIACVHHASVVTKPLCSWLPQHMSWEFPGRLPARISKCYDLSPNRFGPYKFSDRVVRFRSKLGNNLILQTGKVGPDGLAWLRLAFFGRAKPRLAALPPPTPYKGD